MQKKVDTQTEHGKLTDKMGFLPQEEAHTIIGGRVFPRLFSHLHFAIFVTFFGAGSVVGGEWRPQEEVYFGVSTF